MNILDISRVAWTITRLDVTARAEDTRFLHRWIIGEKPPHIKEGGRMFWEVRRGEISIVKRKINGHCDRKANGQPEMGWGLDEKALPCELLEAEITRLDMRCSDGVTYTVSVDVLMSPIMAEMLTQQMSAPEEADDGAE